MVDSNYNPLSYLLKRHVCVHLASNRCSASRQMLFDNKVLLFDAFKTYNMIRVIKGISIVSDCTVFKITAKHGRIFPSHDGTC